MGLSAIGTVGKLGRACLAGALSRLPSGRQARHNLIEIKSGKKQRRYLRC